MYIPEIIEVKEHLTLLKEAGFITAWELPYENLLTRRSAAIFFVEPAINSDGTFWDKFEKYDNYSKCTNDEKKLSQLAYRITFNKEEKGKNKD